MEKAAVEDLLMMCAEGRVRRYHPIIAGLSVDYEEQVVITGIKSGMQCFMCQVPLEERENLCKIWALRIHESTWAQIALQETEEWIEDYGHGDPDCVHSMENFAWNIHL